MQTRDKYIRLGISMGSMSFMRILLERKSIIQFRGNGNGSENVLIEMEGNEITPYFLTSPSIAS